MGNDDQDLQGAAKAEALAKEATPVKAEIGELGQGQCPQSWRRRIAKAERSVVGNRCAQIKTG
jgi:hypothetical protein